MVQSPHDPQDVAVQQYRRISNTERDHAIGHIATCVGLGYLDQETGDARMEAVQNVVSEQQLARLMGDLPAPVARGKANQRTRSWLMGTRNGRITFHCVTFVLAILLMVVPVETVVSEHWHGLGFAVIAVGGIAGGFAALLATILTACDWKGWKK